MEANKITAQLAQHVEVIEHIMKDSGLVEQIGKAVGQIVHCYKNSGKVLIFGNGGSAADAQHIAAEFVGRFKMERKALPAIAFTTDTSILTALSNDYGYDITFSRQVEAFCQGNDVVIGISTSGNAANVCKALELARKLGAVTIALTGKDGGKVKHAADNVIIAPSCDTARIQEAHITIGHIICDLVEKELFA